MKKLKSKKGETLIESMASVLIFTLSSILLLTMISSANRMNEAAKRESEDYQEQLLYTEKAAASAGAPDARVITVTIDGETAGTIPVNVYSRGKDGDLYSFFRIPDGE